jgi:epsilon-lactone hydrolase
MADDNSPQVTHIAAKQVPVPVALSEAARATLMMERPPGAGYPPLEDKAAWRELVTTRAEAQAKMSAPIAARLRADVSAHPLGGADVYLARPQGDRLLSEDKVLLDIHGGALLFGGGEAAVRFTTAAMALRTGRVAYGVDYRVAPDHPYPAALDDCIAAYRGLLAEVPAERIVISGTSAGGNLAAATLLRARDEGLPTPAGALLLTPELDLTESGDSFDTLMGLDVVLTARLMPVNLAYADGADLAHPYLSPLFGDVSGYPPTFLQSGTRDLFLSNTVRMHRKLRNAGVRADLHVWEGMPHAGFGGLAPEDRELNAEMQAFIGGL